MSESVKGKRVACVCVWERYKWSHNVIPSPFLKILRVCEMAGAIHGVINLNSFFFFFFSIRLSTLCDDDQQTTSGKLMHQHNCSSLKRWHFCFSLSSQVISSRIDFEISLIIFKALYGLAPSYIAHILLPLRCWVQPQILSQGSVGWSRIQDQLWQGSEGCGNSGVAGHMHRKTKKDTFSMPHKLIKDNASITLRSSSLQIVWTYIYTLYKIHRML